MVPDFFIPDWIPRLGLSFEGKGEEGMKAGAFDYLMKPCAIDLLVMKVDRAVIKKREHEGKILEARAQMIALKKGY